MRRHLGIRAALLLILAAVAGCGKGTATVTGKVTYQGQAITSGTVVFYGENGKVDSGILDANGNYTLTRAPVGTVKVAVMVPKIASKGAGGGPPPGPPAGKGKLKTAPVDPSRPVPAPVEKSAIPERYTDAEKSGLVYTVNPGSQIINLELQP